MVRVFVEYDVPSSLLERLGDDRIVRVAGTLGFEPGGLVAAATGVEAGWDRGDGFSRFW